MTPPKQAMLATVAPFLSSNANLVVLMNTDVCKKNEKGVSLLCTWRVRVFGGAKHCPKTFTGLWSW